jgi:hypothetical protein
MRRLILSLLPWVVVSACGGGNDPIPLDTLGARVVAAECAAEARCNQISSQALCRQTFPLDIGQITADVAAGKVIYDGAAAGACLDALGAISCNRSERLASSVDACDRVFVGTLATGAACFSGTECVSGRCDIAVCDPAVTCCAGQCAPKDVVQAIGQDCTAIATTCQEGAFCKFSGGTGVCTAKVAAGQTCDGFEQCASGLWCHMGATGTTGTCVRLPARGQPCDEQTLPCDSIADTCGPAGVCVALVGDGADCVVDTDCRSDARCLGTGKCGPKGTVADPCTDEADCLTWLECTNGACAARAPRAVCP